MSIEQIATLMKKRISVFGVYDSGNKIQKQAVNVKMLKAQISSLKTQVETQ